MAPIVASLTRPAGLAGLDRRTLGIAGAAAIAGTAWLVAVGLEWTGAAPLLHHHALIQSGELPLWLGIPVFLVAWQVMIASMMLPASLRAVGVVADSRFIARPATALLGFLGAYSLVWSGFGLAAFVGDIGLHWLAATSPWLATHLWVIPAGSLALAGAYQLMPWRVGALEACRHPSRRLATVGGGSDVRAGFRAGLAHGVDCLASSWALMLLMFAIGVANLAWMAVLAGVMAYEALGPHGRLAGAAFGLLLIALGVLVATGVPAGF